MSKFVFSPHGKKTNKKNNSIDFSNLHNASSDKTASNDCNNSDNYDRYDEKTKLYYKALRHRKMDPILLLDIVDQPYFSYPYQWNPYTGNKLDKDPNGPLVFDPDTLIKYYYENRLNNLWVPEVQNGFEYFQGYYDVAVGAGQEIYIQSRGYNPDKYLFRLPIIDCYCDPKIDNNIVVTMGPKLSDAEIQEIEYEASKYPDNYYLNYGVRRPSLIQIKKLYDLAISNNSNVTNLEQQIIGNCNETDINIINRLAVDKLRTLVG